MKTVTQYKEDIRVLMEKSATYDAQCVAENRDLTEAERTYKNEIMDTVNEYRDIVKTMERQERITSELETPATPLTVPKNAKIKVGDELRAKDKFSSFGEQMAAVMRAGISGGRVDPRLRNIQAATGAGESTPSDGGFLVQQDYSSELLQQVIETGILAQRCRRQPISGPSNSIKIPGVDETSRVSSRFGGIIAYWKDEAQTKTATKPKFREIELNLKKLIGAIYATDELLQDAAALEAFLKAAFVSEFGFQIDDAIFQGNGAGKPLGFMNGGGLVTVSAETGQPAATIMTENIVNMYSRRFAGKTQNYVWLYNQAIEPQLFTMSLGVGTGGSAVYMPPGGLSALPYGQLLGLPALAIEQAAALGTTGDIVLANLPDGYILAEKGGIQQDMSIHVEFLADEIIFRFVLRTDGQPVRASVLTPYKGGSGATQSHFVALETRS